MAAIPADICRYIARFISQDDLCTMLSVNSTFFQLAMDAKYQDVTFANFNDATMKAIRRLRDPAVAYRVRRLFVNPWFSQELVDRSLEQSTESYSAFNTPLGEVVQTMADTVTYLSGVTEFTFDWRSSTASGLPSEEQLLPFLTAAWKSFGPGLRNVVLRAPSNKFPVLLSTASGFRAIQELEVELNYDSTLDRQQESNLLTTVLVPFINGTASTLRSLSITSWPGPWPHGVDLTPFFRSLVNICNLERLNIIAQMEMCGLSEPLGLSRILRDHTLTLRHVKWTPPIPQWNLLKHTSDDPFVAWLEENRSDESILSNLLTLDGGPLPPGPAALQLMVGYLRRSMDTLTSLTLLSEYLSYEEVKAVVSIFAHRPAGRHLRYINLRVKVLSVELLLLLSQTLPHLDRLRIDVMEIERPKGAEAMQFSVWESELPEVEFASRLGKQDIRHWQLLEIDIVVYGGTSPLCRKLELLFAECIPACAPYVKRFYGMVEG